MIKNNWYNMTETEREEYVNQDYVPLRSQEVLSSYIDNFVGDESTYSAWPDPVIIDTPARRKSAIIGLWEDGKSTREISILVECSQPYVVKVVKKEKKVRSDNHFLSLS